MKKETNNTFEGGMIKDSHPLTTPNNVLTDALNATFITYNGNEYILQNDMGNVEIKNALLKAGYVPVGMKEHGGIVYVAAYNPETGKGQVGSFPSPRQIWEGDNWDVNKPAQIIDNPNLNIDFYRNDFIINETIKQEIFRTNDGARIFHPGDKFIIGIAANTYSLLKADVDAGYMDVQLGVIKSDGSIEIMRTWSTDSPDTIFYQGSTLPNNVFKDANWKAHVRVFDAASSGQLLLIMNLHTLDSFSINKKYSLFKDGNTDKIRVTFMGEAQKDGETITSDDTWLGLCKEEAGTLVENESQLVIDEGNTETREFTIYPNVPFGIIERMGRNFSINFNKIRTTQDDFGEWRFYVTEKYVKIGWSYDFYNLDESKEIEYIRMYFHKLQDGYTSTNKESIPHVDFQKEYYSGNFEDYINYSDIQIQYKNIYIVEVVKKFKGENNEQTICFKMLYLSSLYNDLYNGFYNTSNSVLEFTKANDGVTGVEFEETLDINLKSSKTRIKKPGENELGTAVNTEDIGSSSYILETTSTALSEIDEDSKLFTSQIVNTYDGTISIKGTVINPEDKYIGVPKSNLVNSLLGACSVENLSLEYKGGQGKTWIQKSNKVFPDPEEGVDQELVTPTKSSSVNNDTMTVTLGDFSDNRIIQGVASTLQSNTFVTKGLKPLLSPSYSKDRKDRVAPYWDSSDLLCIAGEGDDEKTIWYNSTLTGTGEIIKGPDAGGGCDDGGLRTASVLMGKPMTNIFAGSYMGEDAEICFKGLQRNTNCGLISYCDFPSSDGENGGHFLDYQGGNWMIACWKFTDGECRLVNLETPKDLTAKSNVVWPRLDVMLRSILSQLFLVNNVDKTMTYITTDPRFYRHQEGTLVLKFDLNYTSNSGLETTFSDIMTDDKGNLISSYLLSSTNAIDQNKKWNYGTSGDKKGINVMIGGQSTFFEMENLIPNVKLQPQSTIHVELEIPNYYALDQIFEYYQGVNYTHINENSGYEIGAIYAVDTNSYDTPPTPNVDGTFAWQETPTCVKVTGDLNIFRWCANNQQKTVTFKDFGTLFTTKAEYNQWMDIPENEENEVLARVPDTYLNNYTLGHWTDASDEPAPDMYYRVLYSQTTSALKDSVPPQYQIL